MNIIFEYVNMVQGVIKVYLYINLSNDVFYMFSLNELKSVNRVDCLYKDKLCLFQIVNS